METVYPMFIGGNFLLDADDGEVEIAPICLASTTFDVTGVHARPDAGAIRYRVVDEYEGDTLTGQADMAASGPLGLGELSEFFLGARSLFEILEMSFIHDLEASLEFLSSESDFYADFDRFWRQEVSRHFARPGDGNRAARQRRATRQFGLQTFNVINTDNARHYNDEAKSSVTKGEN
jgi:hypothetical protein